MDGTINVRLHSDRCHIYLTNLVLQFFDFQTTNLEHTLILPSTAVSILLHRDSGLLAVVCDDMVVRVVDIETRRVVRELGGFRGRVLDIVWLSLTDLQTLFLTTCLDVLARFTVVNYDVARFHHSDFRCAYRTLDRRLQNGDSRYKRGFLAC